MKNILCFKKNGEITVSSTECKVFDSNLFADFLSYTLYDGYIIMYNDNEKDKNITQFYFTSDRFNGDVILIKVNKNNEIKNLTIEAYFKNLNKIKIEQNEIDYGTDSEFSDSDFNLE